MRARSYLVATGITTMLLGVGSGSAVGATPGCGLATPASIATAVGLPHIAKETGLSEGSSRCDFELWRGSRPKSPKAQRRAIAAGTYSLLEILYAPSGEEPSEFAQFKQAREVQELKELPGPVQTYQPPLFGATSASGHERTGTIPDIRGLWANASHEKFLYLDLYAGRGRRTAFTRVASKVVTAAFG